MPTAVTEAYQGSCASALKAKIEKFNMRSDLMLWTAPAGSENHAGNAGGTVVTVTGSQTPGGQPPRLSCRPVFDASEAPINPASTSLLADVMTTEDFEAKVELLDLDSHDVLFCSVRFLAVPAV